MMELLLTLLKRLQVLLIIGVLLLVTGIVFVPMFQKRQALILQRQELDDKIQTTEQHLMELRRREVDFQSNPHHIEKLARNKMGYSRPGEIIYKFG